MRFFKRLLQKKGSAPQTKEVRGPQQEITAEYREATREPLHEPGNRRVIRTARTEKAINQAARRGLWPLVKPVVPNPEIRSKIAVFQDPQTGEIATSGDYRGGPALPNTLVIEYRFYYPHSFPRPFAAYLLPPDLEVGECVWLEDLIEDRIGGFWNQGDVRRLKAAPAIWNGTDFEVLFDSLRDASEWIG